VDNKFCSKVDFELFDVLEGQVPASLISIQHASLSSSPSRARNRLKPKKNIPEIEKLLFQPKNTPHLDKKLKPEKVFSKPKNCYFNRKPMFLKPENGACNQKITPALKLFSKPQKVSPKPEIAISTENQCFLNRKMVLVIVNSPTKGFGLAQLPKFQASRLVLGHVESISG